MSGEGLRFYIFVKRGKRVRMRRCLWRKAELFPLLSTEDVVVEKVGIDDSLNGTATPC